MKKIYLLFATVFVVLSASADDIPTVTVTGSSGGLPQYGEGAQRLADALAAQNAGSTGNNTTSGSSNTTTPADKKKADCKVAMQYLESNYSACKNLVDTAASKKYQYCTGQIPDDLGRYIDSRGTSSCIGGISYDVTAGDSGCQAQKDKTAADCSGN